MAMLRSIAGLRRRERASICVRTSRAADRDAVPAAELTVLFGLDGPGHRSAVGPQGLGRLVGLGRAAHDRRCCSETDLRRIPAGAKYGGPGSDKLAAAVGALRHRRSSPFVYKSVEHLADDASEDDRGADAAATVMAGRSGSVRALAFLLLLSLLLTLRACDLERQARARRAVSRARGLI